MGRPAAEEVIYLTGLCLWGNEHQVVGGGKVYDMGSFRGTARFIADYINAHFATTRHDAHPGQDAARVAPVEHHPNFADTTTTMIIRPTQTKGSTGTRLPMPFSTCRMSELRPFAHCWKAMGVRR